MNEVPGAAGTVRTPPLYIPGKVKVVLAPAWTNDASSVTPSGAKYKAARNVLPLVTNPPVRQFTTRLLTLLAKLTCPCAHAYRAPAQSASARITGIKPRSFVIITLMLYPDKTGKLLGLVVLVVTKSPPMSKQTILYYQGS